MSGTEKPGARSTLGLVVIAFVGLMPFVHAAAFPGLVHPDEVFQALEPANRLAFGFGVKAWEWDVGLRNWAVPGMLAGLLKLASSIDDPLGRRVLLFLPSLGLHLTALAAVHRFARRRVNEVQANWAVVLVGLSPLTILFAGRTLSESFSAALLVIAFERVDVVEENPKRIGFVSGLLFGLAEVARYGTAPFILVALIWLAWKRSRALPFVVAGGAVIALGLGVLDALTWGGLWHSLIEYTDFNIIKGKAAGFGRSPWWAYLPQLVVLLSTLSVVRWRREPLLRAALPMLAAAVYFVSITAVPHKEDRFLYPAALLVLMATAPAFVSITKRAWVTGASVFAVSVAVVPFVPDGLKPKGSELVSLTMRAQREGTGLLIVHAGLWGSGGSFFAGGSNLMRLADDSAPTASHRWCTADDVNDPCFSQAIADSSVNRAIVLEPEEQTLQAMAAAGFRKTDDPAWFER